MMFLINAGNTSSTEACLRWRSATYRMWDELSVLRDSHSCIEKQIRYQPSTKYRKVISFSIFTLLSGLGRYRSSQPQTSHSHSIFTQKPTPRPHFQSSPPTSPRSSANSAHHPPQPPRPSEHHHRHQPSTSNPYTKPQNPLP